MSINIRRTIGGAVITAAIASGIALTAVAPASAATAETGVATAAVQGDRLQGPFVTRTTLRETGTGVWFWNSWNGYGPAGAPQAGGDAVQGQAGSMAPPTFPKPAEIWTFPAVGTYGPIVNSQGLCLQVVPPIGNGSRIILATCDGSDYQNWNLASDGTINSRAASSYYLTDRYTGTNGRVNMITDPYHDISAEVLYLAGLTPVDPPACTAGLTGSVSNVNQTAKSAVVGGTGKAGETITVSGGPAGAVTTVVGADGKWTATIPGLATGDNKLTVNSSDNCAPVSLSVIIDALEIPVVHPLAAASAGVLGLGALLVGGLRRRANAKA